MSGRRAGVPGRQDDLERANTDYRRGLPAAPGRVALIIVDSYNDFLSEEGLTWPMLKLVAEENDLVGKLGGGGARRQGAHRVRAHRYREGSFSGRKHLNPSQYLQITSESFAEGHAVSGGEETQP